jgi:hypothetical protein
MTAHLPGVTPPQGANVAIRIELTAQANITPFVARQRVTGFVTQEISDRMRGEEPELVVGERLCWSVPVVLTSPTRGVVGKVVRSSSMPRPVSCSWRRTPFRG